MTDNTKLGKRTHVIVVEGRLDRRTRSSETGEWICEYQQHFTLAQVHQKGSSQPQGYYRATYSCGTAHVRWLHTDSNGYFAPEITFQAKDGREVFKLVEKLGKAFKDLPSYGDGCNPEALIEKVQAAVVEYVESGWRDYRPLRLPNESPLMTLARAAD